VEWLDRLFTLKGSGTHLVALDVPIGLPQAYATAAGIDSFRDSLLQFGSGPWASFYQPAADIGQISSRRPFYPDGTGSLREYEHGRHFLRVGVRSADELLRRCDRVQEAPASSFLFWTRGQSQVGRSAISAWRELLGPALRSHLGRVAIWPFDGHLCDLIGHSEVVFAETRPAASLHLTWPGHPRRTAWNKRRQHHRMQWAAELPRLRQDLGVELSDEVERDIRDGFGPGDSGSDQFDAVVGLMAMIRAVREPVRGTGPQSPSAARVEGWVLGLPATDAGVSPPKASQARCRVSPD
jgi:hypothetical protein